MASVQTPSPQHQRHLSGMWKEPEVATPGHSCLSLQLPPTWEGAARPVPGSPVRPQLNCVLFKSLPRDESWASGGGGSRPPAWTPGAGRRQGGHLPAGCRGTCARGSPCSHRRGYQVHRSELQVMRTRQAARPLTPPCSLIPSWDSF